MNSRLLDTNSATKVIMMSDDGEYWMHGSEEAEAREIKKLKGLEAQQKSSFVMDMDEPIPREFDVVDLLSTTDKLIGRNGRQVSVDIFLSSL